MLFLARWSAPGTSRSKVSRPVFLIRLALVRSLLRVFGLAILLSTASVAGAYEIPDEGLLLVDDRGETSQAPMVGSWVDLRVDGWIARATVTQIFVHPGDRPVEALFLLPLPENAAVGGLRMRVGERVTEGRVEARQVAQDTFDEARAQGQTASLVEQAQGNRFTVSVTQIAPGDTVEVELKMQFEVRNDDGTFYLRFPLAVPERYRLPGATEGPSAPVPARADGVDPVAFRIDLDAGVPLAEIHSPSHSLKVDAPSPSRRVVTLADEIVASDRDFVLRWTPEPSIAPRAVAYGQERDDAHYGLLMLFPPEAEGIRPVSREVIYVLDTSGSMKGERLAKARRALKTALERLRSDDLFNVMRFSDGFERVFPETRPATPTQLATAMDFVEGLKADGGTNIHLALDGVMERPVTAGRLHQIVLITDGQVSNEQGLLSHLGRTLGERRLFTVGIGAAPNGHFMRRAAERGRGTYTFIEGNEDIDAAIGRLLRKLERPAVHGLEIFWDDPTAESWPNPLGDLYAGEPLVVAVRSQSPPAGRILGWLGGQPWEQRFDLAGRHSPLLRPAEGIDRLWARRKIEAMTATATLSGMTDEIRNSVVELALEHQLITDYTAFVAVDSTARVSEDTPPEKHVVPRSTVADRALTFLAIDVAEEQIVVTAESPMVLSTSYSLGQDLDESQTLTSTFGGLIRSHAGLQMATSEKAGAEELTGMVGAGTESGETRWQVDRSTLEQPPAGLRAALALQKTLEVVHGGTSVDVVDGGALVLLTGDSGGNRWRGAFRDLTGGSVESSSDRDFAEGDERRDGLVEVTADLAGPLMRDHLWLWSGASRREDDGQVLGGELEALEPRAVDQVQSLSLVLGTDRWDTRLRGYRGKDDIFGAHASADRVGSALRDRRGRLALGSLGSTWIGHPNVYMEGSISRSELERSSRSAAENVALWDANGLLRGQSVATEERGDRLEARLQGSYYLSSGFGDHELELGVSSTEIDQRLSRRAVTDGVPGEVGILSIAGINLGVPSETLAWLEATGETSLDRRNTALWAQDTWQYRDVQVLVGGRWERWQGDVVGSDNPGDDVDWTAFSPRLHVMWTSPGGLAMVQLGASRFRGALRREVLEETVPSAVGRALVRFEDRDGDRLFEPGERSTLLSSSGFDRANDLDIGLAPETTDELMFGLQLMPGYRYAWRLRAVHRQTHDVHERRRWVDDGTGRRLARRDDYRLDHLLAVPSVDGSLATAPVYSLRPGIAFAGAFRRLNGDRERYYNGLTLEMEKQSRGRFHLRAAFHVGEHRWRLGPDFEAHRDPTNVQGGQDDEDGPVLGYPTDRDLGDGWLGGRWSFRLEGGVDLGRDEPWGFRLGGVVQGRDGHPLPIFASDLASVDGILRRVELGAADSRKLEDIWTFDLRLDKTFELREGLDLEAGLELRNVFETDDVLRRELDLASPRAGLIEARHMGREVIVGLRLGWG